MQVMFDCFVFSSSFERFLVSLCAAASIAVAVSFFLLFVDAVDGVENLPIRVPSSRG
jgi:hypothetical protein